MYFFFFFFFGSLRSDINRKKDYFAQYLQDDSKVFCFLVPKIIHLNSAFRRKVFLRFFLRFSILDSQQFPLLVIHSRLIFTEVNTIIHVFSFHTKQVS